MLLQADAKALEWVCAAYLSQDQTAIKEIRDGTDQHSDNQLRFGLPSRLIAKTFVFRLIYGGSAYSYANDTNFTDVSTSESFWQNVIDEFYNKYTELGEWHKKIVATAMKDRKITMPTGASRHCYLSIFHSCCHNLFMPFTKLCILVIELVNNILPKGFTSTYICEISVVSITISRTTIDKPKDKGLSNEARRKPKTKLIIAVLISSISYLLYSCLIL